MIDPLAAIIALLYANANLNALTAGRIAAKHKFALPETDPLRWVNPSKALQVTLAPGADVDLDSARQLPRLEARCYGESEFEAAKVYQALVEATRTDDRAVIDTGAGKALIYWLLMDGSASFLFDAELEIDTVMAPLRAAVAEDAVP